MKYSALVALVSPIFLASWATPANAQATPSWVSGVGNDNNACSRTAPCATFAGAISKTAAGGEIDCLDPGDFGAVTITVSITLDCEAVSNGGILVAGTNGITITAGTVTLRGLDIDGLGGQGLTGVSIAGATVNIQKTKIYGFGTAGVSLASGATAILTNTRVNNNAAGVLASGDIVLRDVVIDDNSGNGITASASALVDRTMLAFNSGTGLDVNGNGAVVLLGNSTITGNATGVLTSAGALYSFKNNQIGGNTVDGTPIQPLSLALSVGINGSGTVTSSPPGISCGVTCSVDYAINTVVSLTQSAASGSTFAGWSGACGGVGTCIVTMNQAQSVTANFVSGSTPTSQLVAAVLPESRSATVGNPVTAFATIINAGGATASQCAIAPEGDLPLDFLYQTTDPATNGLVGTANTPVDIPGGNGVQTFVIALTPTAAFAPVQVPFSFACSNVLPAPIVTGLNTLLLSSSTTPVPDIVALVATASNDGILHIPGASGANAFAVATVNVGTADTITATANTGSVQLPLSISLCETDPASGKCITPIGASVAVAIAANATPTFAIFGQASGTIPFDPTNNRIFVQFTDSGGAVRGATSVAVETQ
jgi:hypothetical protein